MKAANSDAPDRVVALDVLRCVAALAVVAFHFLHRGPATGDMPVVALPFGSGMAKLGYLGVHLFFLISGFSIVLSLPGKTAASFFRSRLVRLFPAYLCAVLLTTLAVHLFDAQQLQIPWPAVLANVTMLPHLFGVPSVDGVYWSLQVEVGFYLLAGVGIAYLRRWPPEYLLAGWLLLSAAWQWLPSYSIDLLLTTQYAPFFAGGAVAALIFRRGSSALRWGLYALAMLLGLTLMCGLTPARSLDAGEEAMQVGMVIVVGFVAIGLIAARMFRGIGGGRVWQALGALTYPLYLVHQNIGYVAFGQLAANQRTPLGPADVAAVTLSMIALAWAIHRFVERPIAKALKRSPAGAEGVAGKAV